MRRNSNVAQAGGDRTADVVEHPSRNMNSFIQPVLIFPPTGKAALSLTEDKMAPIVLWPCPQDCDCRRAKRNDVPSLVLGTLRRQGDRGTIEIDLAPFKVTDLGFALSR